jgi:hypothetical protein
VARNLQFLIFAVGLTASLAGIAEDKPVGFLCCNMRTDGSWISDINYDENGKRIIPVGTPIKVTGYGRYRVKVDVNGKSQAIGNDYSRENRHLSQENTGCHCSSANRSRHDP